MSKSKSRATRPSPSKSASKTPSGTVSRGNDKKVWICKEMADGTRRWVRSGEGPGRSYITHDNGGSPFKVFVDKNEVIVFVWDMELQDQISECYRKSPRKLRSKMSEHAYTKKVWQTKKAEEVFIGGTPKQKFSLGNSVLVQLAGQRFVFIGDRIFSFKADEKIESYFSPIGNSDVPYPWAVGKDNVYLIGEELRVANSQLGKTKDPYEYFYQLPSTVSKRMKKENSFKGVKSIVKRVCG